MSVLTQPGCMTTAAMPKGARSKDRTRLSMFNAALLTLIANIVKKPPLWGMATAQMRVMRSGFVFDGSKAERELGIAYTPIQVALEDAIASLREG